MAEALQQEAACKGIGDATETDEAQDRARRPAPLPYDGMTRTGSKGLSQPHQDRRGTPNVTPQLTGIAALWQES
jgi:hypothetical protein